MSEIKEELEHFAALSEEKANINQENVAQKDNLSQDLEQYLEAPKGYEQEIAKTFKDLPLKWRQYLHAREQELDKGFSDIRNRAGDYKWLEDIYTSKAGSFTKNGTSTTKDWIQNMVKIDDMLEQDPAGTISLLASSYGLNKANNISQMLSQNHHKILSDVMGEQMVAKQLNDFIGETDERGSLKHPYYRDVIADMYDLINKGVVTNLKDAYETAVWSNSSTRAKLIAERTKETLEEKSKSAQKSKEASFVLKGRGSKDTKDLSLREELKMRFAELGYGDDD